MESPTLFEGRTRLVNSAEPNQDLGFGDEESGAVVAEALGLHDVMQCLFVAAERGENSAEVEMQGGGIGSGCDRIRQELDRVLSHAFEEVWQLAHERDISPRTAAYMLGSSISEVGEGIEKLVRKVLDLA